MTTETGFIPVEGGKVWYKVTGNTKGTPLVVLHGGPGYPHDYLEPLEDLAIDRKVVFYDQLGCGNSEKTADSQLWTVEKFVEELRQVVAALELGTYHILGHSWGSALAVSFALTKPIGLASLILSDPYLSSPVWDRDAKRLIGLLPRDMQGVLKNEKSSPDERRQVLREYEFRYIFRMDPHPEPCNESDRKMSREIYNFMWGPRESEISGTLCNLDLTPRLPEITKPVLLLCGRYDEATPEACEYFRSLFPNAQPSFFEDSAHFPFWNKRGEYMKRVQKFLGEMEAA